MDATFDDWKGGWNSYRKGHGLRDDQLTDILNCRYVDTPQGLGLMPRPGLEELTATGTSTGTSIMDIGKFVDSSGSEHTLVASDSKLWEFTTGPASLTSLGDLESTRGRMVQFGNNLAVFDGGYLKYFTGTTLLMAHDTEGTLLDNTSDDQDGSVSLYDGGVERFGQNFQTPDWGSYGYTVPLQMISFVVAAIGSPTGNAYARAYNAAGTIIASSAAVDISAWGASPQTADFAFSAGSLDMATQTSYRFVLDVGGTGTSVGNYIKGYYSNTLSLGGSLTTYGGTWGTDATKNALMSVGPGLPPKSSFGWPHVDRLIIEDKEDTNRAHYSGTNTLNQWSGTGAGWLDYMTEGADITAIRPFYKSIAIHLAGGGPRAVFLLSGSGPTDYTLERAAPGVAAINQDVCHFTGDDQIFLDYTGIYSLVAVTQYGNTQAAARSEDVYDVVVQNASDSSFAGTCLGHKQIWWGLGLSYFLVYDVFRKVYTKYQFNMGNTITSLHEYNGLVLVGDYAGKLWQYSLSSPVYLDGGTSYGSLTYFKLKRHDFGTELVKRLRFVNVRSRARLGGSYDIKIYPDMLEDAIKSISVVIPADPDLTVDEATMTVDEAIFTLDYSGSSMKLHKIMLEAQNFMIGIENIVPNNGIMLFTQIKQSVALLTRYWDS